VKRRTASIRKEKGDEETFSLFDVIHNENNGIRSGGREAREVRNHKAYLYLTHAAPWVGRKRNERDW
jgi:hypothetical protein